MRLSEEKEKKLKNMGFKWTVLVWLESRLYIASVMFIENRQKQTKKKRYCA